MKRNWKPLTVRVTPEQDQYIDKLSKDMTKKTGMHVGKNDIVREALSVSSNHTDEFFKDRKVD